MPVTRSALASRAALLPCIAVGADDRRDLAANASIRSHPLALRAELRMEGDVVELGQELSKPRPAVLVPEELRIGKPRRDDPVVAGDDFLAAIPGDHVRDEKIMIGQTAIRLAQAKAFLMAADRGDDHFRRQRQEIRRRTTPSAPPAIRRAQPFPSAAPRPRPLQALGEGKRIALRPNRRDPFCGIQHDPGIAQLQSHSPRSGGP